MGNCHLMHSHAEDTTLPVGLSEEAPRMAPAVCGRLLAKDEDDYCNISVADPGWDKDWCEPCVIAIAWSNEFTLKWQERGIGAMELTDYFQWLRKPEGEYARQSFRRYMEMTRGG